MKVLFLEHVINVGKPGEIKEVKPGYATNMLFPKKLAVELTLAEEKKHKERLKREEHHKRELIENRHQIAETLNGKVFTFALRTSTNGKVFGGIGEKDLIGEIKKQFKFELTKKHIEMPDGHLKKVGEHMLFIKLGKDSMAKITVIVNSL